MGKYNERIPKSPPTISPLTTKKQNRPLWSIMIPTFNCSQFLPDVLQSVLSQDMGVDHMQIEIIDDASTDADIEGIVREIGKGRINYFRQITNVGSLRNFETCINRSKGQLVHLLHGDDRVCYGFYKEFSLLFNKYPEAGAAFCNYNFINEIGIIDSCALLEEQEAGILQNWLIRIAERQKIQFASMVVKRDVYEQLGSFYGMSYGEDWEMWVRIAKHYQVAFTPKVLAEYRTHSNSLTSKNVLEGNIYRDMCRVMNIIQSHLPLKHRDEILYKNKINCAHSLIGTANIIWKETHNYKLTKLMIVQSLQLHRDLNTISRVLKLLVFICLNHKNKNINKYDTDSLDTNN